MMFRSNMGFAESLVWEALRQLAVAWPRLKIATMAFFNSLLDNQRGRVEHDSRVAVSANKAILFSSSGDEQHGMAEMDRIVAKRRFGRRSQAHSAKTSWAAPMVASTSSSV